jgi:hypothetical protein
MTTGATGDHSVASGGHGRLFTHRDVVLLHRNRACRPKVTETGGASADVEEIEPPWTQSDERSRRRQFVVIGVDVQFAETVGEVVGAATQVRPF